MRRGISNIIGALLFIIAVIAIISITMVAFYQLGTYADTIHYMESLERDRLFERLIVNASYNSTDGTLIVEMTNAGSVVIHIVTLLIHDLDNGFLYEAPVFEKIIAPGQSTAYQITTNITNANVILITSRGNSYMIIIRNGVVQS